MKIWNVYVNILLSFGIMFMSILQKYIASRLIEMLNRVTSKTIQYSVPQVCFW